MNQKEQDQNKYHPACHIARNICHIKNMRIHIAVHLRFDNRAVPQGHIIEGKTAAIERIFCILFRKNHIAVKQSIHVPVKDHIDIFLSLRPGGQKLHILFRHFFFLDINMQPLQTFLRLPHIVVFTVYFIQCIPKPYVFHNLCRQHTCNQRNNGHQNQFQRQPASAFSLN